MQKNEDLSQGQRCCIIGVVIGPPRRLVSPCRSCTHYVVRSCTAWSRDAESRTGIQAVQIRLAYYLQEIPGCYVRFGTRGPDDDYISLHSPLFDVDEEVLGVGARFFDRVTREAFEAFGAGKDAVDTIPQTNV